MQVLDKPSTSETTATPQPELLFISEEKMKEFRAIVARQFEEFGIDYDPNVTPEQVWAIMRADGIRPEDNFLSRAIVSAREE